MDSIPQGTPPPTERNVVCSKQVRIIIDWMRLLFAATALVTALKSAAGLSPLAAAAWLFAGYALAALFVDLGTHRGNSHRLLLWLDAGWVVLLFALSGGSADYLHYLILPVLFAGVSTELDESIRLSTFTALLGFTVLAFHIDDSTWQRALVVPFSLLVAGPAVTLLMRRGTAPNRALASASALVASLEPNRGVETLAVELLDRLSEALGADVSLVAIRTLAGDSRVFLGEQGSAPNELPPAAASVGVSLFAVKHSRLVTPGPGRFLGWTRGILSGEAPAGVGAAEVDGDLAELVERPYLAIAVAGDAEEGALRLLLGRGRRRFDEQDLDLAQQVVRLALPVFRNACLIERLTARVAEMERLRIGRDLHDSAIQPYIGLKFAIEALARKVPPADPLAADIGRVLAMMQDELGTMRSVIKGLRQNEAEARPLALAIRSQVRRLADLYDLQVDIDADDTLSVGSALGKEIPHMVSEALSNIRRHTRSRQARVSLSRQGESLVLAIHNQAPDGGQAATAFEPKSLSSRAAALGGYTSIHTDGGGTTVTICLPMH